MEQVYQGSEVNPLFGGDPDAKRALQAQVLETAKGVENVPQEVHIHSDTYVRTRTHTRTHARARTHTHTHTHTYTHTPTHHTHTHTRTHTYNTQHTHALHTYILTLRTHICMSSCTHMTYA